jgi:hypothetical protein
MRRALSGLALRRGSTRSCQIAGGVLGKGDALPAAWRPIKKVEPFFVKNQVRLSVNRRTSFNKILLINDLILSKFNFLQH